MLMFGGSSPDMVLGEGRSERHVQIRLTGLVCREDPPPWEARLPSSRGGGHAGIAQPRKGAPHTPTPQPRPLPRHTSPHGWRAGSPGESAAICLV